MRLRKSVQPSSPKQSEDRPIGPDEWGLYSLYGLTLATDFPFVSRLPAPGSGPPDLTFTCVASSPLPGALEGAEPIYTSLPGDEDGESTVHLYRLESCLVLSLSTFDFYLWPDRIVCHLRRNPEHHLLIESLLLSGVFACWLEWQGIPALHASTVVVDGGAVAFLAPPRSGKSSLVTALMQAGHPLLTDDILPIEHLDEAYLGRSSYPQVRMWPDQARQLLGRYEDFDLIRPACDKRGVPVGGNGFGTFCEASQPLACLYLPNRRDPSEWGTRIRISPVSPREELMTLIQHSFVLPIVEALGLHAHRFGFFTRMVSQAPMRRVVYPDGLEHLPRVRQAILDDLADLRPLAPLPKEATADD